LYGAKSPPTRSAEGTHTVPYAASSSHDPYGESTSWKSVNAAGSVSSYSVAAAAVSEVTPPNDASASPGLANPPLGGGSAVTGERTGAYAGETPHPIATDAPARSATAKVSRERVLRAIGAIEVSLGRDTPIR
jgi:hypothetical protein